jgi:hypothetical protein
VLDAALANPAAAPISAAQIASSAGEPLRRSPQRPPHSFLLRLVTASLTGIEQRVTILSDQIRILNDGYTRQIEAKERQLHSLDIQIRALESRLNELEDQFRIRR